MVRKAVARRLTASMVRISSSTVDISRRWMPDCISMPEAAPVMAWARARWVLTVPSEMCRRSAISF